MHGAPGKKKSIARASFTRCKLLHGNDAKRIVSWLPSKFIGTPKRPAGNASRSRFANSAKSIGFSSKRYARTARRSG